MSGPTSTTFQRIAEIERMQEEGQTGDAIARHFGISRRTLYRFIKRWKDRQVMA